MIIRLVLVPNVSELYQCESVTRQLFRAMTCDNEAFSLPSLSLPFVPFATTNGSISTRRYLHLRTDTHCDDDCKRSNAPNQLEKELQTNNKQEAPRCWPVGEGWMFQRTRWMELRRWRLFWGSLAGLFRGGNTFFPGGVWGTEPGAAPL